MIREQMPQFQTDYLISWDFSNADLPCVSVVCLEKDKDEQRVVGRFIGKSHANAGVISLRQLLEYRDNQDRRENERKNDAERLRREFIAKTEKEVET